MSSQSDRSGDLDAPPSAPDEEQRGNCETAASPRIDVRFETASSSYDEEAVRRRKLGYGLNKKPGSLKDRLAAFQGKTGGDENNYNNAGGRGYGGRGRGSSRPGKLNVSMFDKGATPPATAAADEPKVSKHRSAGKLAARMAMFQSSSRDVTPKPASKSSNRGSEKRASATRSGVEGRWPVEVLDVGKCDSSQKSSASLSMSPQGNSLDVGAKSTNTSASDVPSAPCPSQTKEEIRAEVQKTEKLESRSSEFSVLDSSLKKEGTQTEGPTAESDASLKQDGKRELPESATAVVDEIQNGGVVTEQDLLDLPCGISKSDDGNGPDSKLISKGDDLFQHASCEEGPKIADEEMEGGEESSERISAEHAKREDPDGKDNCEEGGGEGPIVATIGAGSSPVCCDGPRDDGTDGKSAAKEEPSDAAVGEDEARKEEQMKLRLEEGSCTKPSDSANPADDKMVGKAEEKSNTVLIKEDAWQNAGTSLECNERSDENDAKEPPNEKEQTKSQLEEEVIKPSYSRDDETGGKEEETSNAVSAEKDSWQNAGSSIECNDGPGRKDVKEGHDRTNVKEGELPALSINQPREEGQTKFQLKEGKYLKPRGSLSSNGEMAVEEEISSAVSAEEDVQQKAKEGMAEKWGYVAREEEAESAGLAEELRLETQRLAAEQAELQRLEREKRLAEKEKSFRQKEDERHRDQEMLAALEEKRLIDREAHGSYAKYTPIKDDAAPPRDLTPEEMESLHAILKTQVENRPMYNVLNDEQDAEDLLDYTLDMVGDCATVGHVVEEVAFLGFKCFTEEVEERFGRCLTKFFGNMP